MASALLEQLSKHIKKDAIQPPHLIVEARAGTGKTTTLVEGLWGVLGSPSNMTPSEQQRVIWDSMALSKGTPKEEICFVAFNKSIATELQRRVPSGVSAMTMHSLGFKAVNSRLGRQKPDSWVLRDHVGALLGMDGREVTKNKLALAMPVEELVELCKVNLLEPTAKNLDQLINHYDVELTDASIAQIYDLVPRVLELCKKPRGKITFSDMIWLPVVLDLPLHRYGLLLVDEAQDLNRCQQELAMRSGKRLIFCGDRRQAIYGFAGAGTRMLDDLYEALSKHQQGCEILPLTVTRRCGKAIVKEANKIVADFEALETNSKGAIYRARYLGETVPLNKELAKDATVLQRAMARTDKQRDTASYQDLVGDGDMVLCRVNAPLVSQCFRFIKAGRKANIQGRDVASGLISTIKKLKAKNVQELITKLGDWLATEQKKESAKRNPSDGRLIILQDRHDCLLCFTDGLDADDDIEKVTEKINAIFVDDKDAKGIRLSSIHKAKGLEAKRVFILQPKAGKCPHPMARSQWQREQEYNLLYVAITRAIDELVFVEDGQS